MSENSNNDNSNNNNRDSSKSPTKNISEQLRYKTTRDVTVVGAIVNTILAIVKILLGYIGQSQALIADGLHSLSDLASDIVIIFAAKHSSREADENHPYGHGRIETLFTVFLGIFLILVAVGILNDSVRRLFEPETLLQPGFIALAAALFSVLANEALYQYTQRAATRIRSKLLEANAWHHRTDAVSSIIVIIGISGSMLGIDSLDAIAAVAMALYIVKIGWRICSNSIHELIDTGLSVTQVAQITDTIKTIPGVEHMHTLRTRSIGNNVLVDVHIQVAPKLSVSEGHFISEQVRLALLELVLDITDVTVHIDPEDDEIPEYDQELPNRQTLVRQLRKNWADLPSVTAHIEQINLHYLDDQIHIELLLPLSLIDHGQDADKIAHEIQTRVAGQKFIAGVKVIFYIDEDGPATG